MIVTKYNEPTREGHRLDLILTTPYTILVDESDRAFDVRFPSCARAGFTSSLRAITFSRITRARI